MAREGCFAALYKPGDLFPHISILPKSTQQSEKNEDFLRSELSLFGNSPPRVPEQA
jgi:hypothetical protein